MTSRAAEWMRWVLVGWSTATLVAACGAYHAAGILVTEPASPRPIAGANVTCIDPQGSSAMAGKDGRATLPACRRVRCEGEGWLPGEASVESGGATCRVAPALLLSGDLVGVASPEGMEARLLAEAGGQPAVSSRLEPPAKGTTGPVRFTFPAVRPGRYALEVARAQDGWVCRADLGPVPAGHQTTAAVWRPPLVLAGRVVGADESAVPGIVVRAYQPRNQGRSSAEDDRPVRGKFDCAPGTLSAATTSDAGTFAVAVDPGREVLLVAGEWKDPRGIASLTLDRPPQTPVVLRPAKPVRVRARVLDGDGRPVACKGKVSPRAIEASWLIRAVPGGSLEAKCSGEGDLLVGPFPSSDFHLGVDPRPGLPIALEEGAPPPGTTAELGVLKVDNGEEIRLRVESKSGAPVPGAKVRARGAAGIVLTVEGTTDARGETELAGFPEGATYLLEVRARGYAAKWVGGVRPEPGTAYRVVLDPAGVVEGVVRDTEGGSVTGAEVSIADAEGKPSDRATSDEGGRFSFEQAPPGRASLTARAAGYRDGGPLAVDIKTDEPSPKVEIVLEPARGLCGKVVDDRGRPVPGARVLLLASRGLEDIDQASPAADATAGADGSFTLRAQPQPNDVVVALAQGFGPSVEKSPLAKSDQPFVLSLPRSASLRALLPSQVDPSRLVQAVDGNGVGRTRRAAGETEILFENLAPGQGSARLVGAGAKPVSLATGQVAEVALVAGASVEGTVTLDGAPLPRMVVEALKTANGGLSGGPVRSTDERGRFRFESLEEATYLLVADGAAGRAEAKVRVPEEGVVTSDMVVIPVRANVIATSGKDNRPIAGAKLIFQPAGAKCTGYIGATSWGGDGSTPGFSLSASDDGCRHGETGPEGALRLNFRASGAYEVSAKAEGYEPYTGSTTLARGENAVAVRLDPRASRKVKLVLDTEPPGLAGTVGCYTRDGSHSVSPVSGSFDCPELPPGPGEASFRVDGYGMGYATFTIPESGEITVTVVTRRGGELVLPFPSRTAEPPPVWDGAGVDWTTVLLYRGGQALVTWTERPEVGGAWVFGGLQPGTYTVEVGGSRRGPFEIRAGEATVAW